MRNTVEVPIDKNGVLSKIERWIIGGGVVIKGETLSGEEVLRRASADRSFRDALLGPCEESGETYFSGDIYSSRQALSGEKYSGTLTVIDEDSFFDALDLDLRPYVKLAKVNPKTRLAEPVWEIGLIDEKGIPTSEHLDVLRLKPAFDRYFSFERLNDHFSLTFKI